MSMEPVDTFGYDGRAVVTLDDAALLRGLGDLTWRLGDLLGAGGTCLVVDISGLERLSSATLAALLRAQRICRARGGRVVVRGANRRCREVLARTGLSGFFEIEPSAGRTDGLRAAAGSPA
jgi:ABC-type transporter Mla MlaB component